MEFCDIDCFMQSRYFEDKNAKVIKDMQDDFDKNIKDAEDETEAVTKVAKQTLKYLEEFLEKWDDKFETGNEDLDKILLEITKIKEDGDI